MLARCEVAQRSWSTGPWPRSPKLCEMTSVSAARADARDAETRRMKNQALEARRRRDGQRMLRRHVCDIPRHERLSVRVLFGLACVVVGSESVVLQKWIVASRTVSVHESWERASAVLMCCGLFATRTNQCRTHWIEARVLALSEDEAEIEEP
jgi:hypothetical protein